MESNKSDCGGGTYQYPRYLGDAVYALYDGYHVFLRIGSHENTEGEIALDPNVFKALVGYVEDIKIINNERKNRQNHG